MARRVQAVLCAGFCAALAVTAAFAAPAPAPSSALHPFQHLYVPASAVRVTRNAEGRTVIVNENTVQHARRFSGTLLPVPDLPGMPVGSLEPIIQRHCDEQRLDARLVRAVIQVESGYNRHARSNKGAMGLMQLMPDTALELAVHNPFDVEENLRGGITYLRQLIDTFPGSLEMAIAAYNAGPGAVERHRGIPPYPDTIDYVRRVMALYQGDSPGTMGLVRSMGTLASLGATKAATGVAGMNRTNQLAPTTGANRAVGKARGAEGAMSTATLAKNVERAGSMPAVVPAVQRSTVHRPAPYVTRGANGRLVVTTSLSALR